MRASPPFAMHGGARVQSKPLGDEVMGGPNISTSPFSFARRGTKMTCPSVLAHQ